MTGEGRAQRLAARETALGVPEVLWVGANAVLAAHDDAPATVPTAREGQSFCPLPPYARP